MLGAVLLAIASPLISLAEEAVRGDAVIRAPLGDSELVLTTTSRLAGAVHSIRWNGREFIDSADHGRQLQTATNLDAGGPIFAETFNPTEAGSRRDGAGQTSYSRLLHLVAGERAMQTTTQAAFWLTPGEKSGGRLAKNNTVLSNHLFTKRITLGYKNLPQVLVYDITCGLPVGEQHTQCVFEIVTGYMPPEFAKFQTYDPQTRSLGPVSDGPGEQPRPMVFATEDDAFAMGVFTPPVTRGAGWTGPGYGRFRFAAEKVVKWNCVFRLQARGGIPAGDYSFRAFVPLGNVELVRAALDALHEEFKE